MTRTFGESYASAYDALYADKNYEFECDLIESLAREHGRGSASVLDLGCGTGSHAVILARRGMTVTGVDLSPEMLDIARRRSLNSGAAGLELRLGDVRSVRVGQRFDVVLLMFAVLGYQLTDDDVVSTLRTAALHLRPDGVLILDVWNGPAVEGLGPTVRSKVVSKENGTVRRTATGTLDTASKTCLVSYTIENLSNGQVIRTDREQHRMRYFFKGDVETLAFRAGLVVSLSGAFPDVGRAPSETDWNALYVLTPVRHTRASSGSAKFA